MVCTHRLFYALRYCDAVWCGVVWCGVVVWLVWFDEPLCLGYACSGVELRVGEVIPEARDHPENFSEIDVECPVSHHSTLR